jgi:hypothetical protein
LKCRYFLAILAFFISMHFLLQPILFGQIFIALIASSQRRHVRSSFVKATLLFFAFIAVSTEALSAFSLLTPNVVVAWWLAADLTLFAYLFFRFRGRRGDALLAYKKLRQRAERWSAPVSHKLFIGILFVVYSVVFLSAFNRPTTVD